MRFCSRCGFQLGEITALIETGGVPSTPNVVDAKGVSQLASRRGARQGAKLMLAGVVLIPVAIGVSILLDSPLPLFLPATVFLLGLAWLLYFRMFGDEVSSSELKTVSMGQLGTNEKLLSPARTGFSETVTRPTPRTAEIVQPSSVTEHTTKLLEEK